MQKNTEQITSVLHPQSAEPNYQLRRYLPCPELAELVEQYWFVRWQLAENKPHVQKNLPDPNFHLTFELGRAQLVGPVSKVFEYEMSGRGEIFGVKFKAGVVAELLSKSAIDFVDQTLMASDYFAGGLEQVTTKLHLGVSDEEAVALIESWLLRYRFVASARCKKVQEQLAMIKTNSDLNRVQQLCELSGSSERSLQRNFNQYLGFSPKWLIRKYRLQQAIAALDAQRQSLVEIAVQLNYTDQSHLIRDFKAVIGQTPERYRTES